MNKVYGIAKDFSYIRYDRTTVTVSYNLQQVDADHYTWNEIYFYKKITGIPSFETIKQAILDDINETVTNDIISGFEWNGAKVWLSRENQFNYKAAYDLAASNETEFLPVTFKFGTDDDPVYYTFKDIDELEQFYIGAVDHINDTLAKGWALKDSIDWTKYGEKKEEPVNTAE